VLFEIVILLTSVCGLIVGAWLNWRARGQRDLKALSGFAIMMALWSFGHLALAYDYHALGIFLILANPLMPTFFLDFSVRFVRSNNAIQSLNNNSSNQSTPYVTRFASWLSFLNQHLTKVYVLSLLVVVASWWLGGGGVIEKAGMNLFLFTTVGWFNLIYTIAIGVLAHVVLLYGWLIHDGNKRRSILALFVVSAWGLLLATSFVFPSAGIDLFPYPMMLLPTYLLLLVYAVVRYQILAVNAFANRALLWLAMMMILLSVIASISAMSGRLGMQALANVPAWQLWIYSIAVLTLTALIYQPLSRLVEKLIYPGARLNETLLDKWSATLAQATDWQQLTRYGEALLSHQLGSKVEVVLISPIVFVPTLASAESENNVCPQLTVLHENNNWRFELQHWQDVSPGMRLSGDVFASLFATRCGVLQQSLELADAERIRLDEQHLVELGGLSAAMAHELRNPLNIISMASMNTDEDTKKHIQTQIQRADRLISDMLIYSGSIQLHYSDVLLKPLFTTLLQQAQLDNVDVTLRVDESLTVSADAHRLQQVLINLLDNASAFLRNVENAKLLIVVELVASVSIASASIATALSMPSRVRIRIHNNGPIIPADFSDSQLFRPFVSKRAGGSGLGLAIVRRIVEAHQGHVVFRDDLGWPVSFEIELPLSSDVSEDAGEDVDANEQVIETAATFMNSNT